MRTPPGYAPLDLQSVLPFAAPHLAGEALEAIEIGDGNLNLVYRVRSATGSVIVKQALPYLRVAGEGWPLTLDRTRLEAEAMRIHAQHAPGLAPQVLHLDETAAAIVMEDLHQHEVWRNAIIAGRDILGVADTLGRYCARTLLGTSRLVMSAEERRTLLPRFENTALSAIPRNWSLPRPTSIPPATGMTKPRPISPRNCGQIAACAPPPRSCAGNFGPARKRSSTGICTPVR